MARHSAEPAGGTAHPKHGISFDFISVGSSSLTFTHRENVSCVCKLAIDNGWVGFFPQYVFGRGVPGVFTCIVRWYTTTFFTWIWLVFIFYHCLWLWFYVTHLLYRVLLLFVYLLVWTPFSWAWGKLLGYPLQLFTSLKIYTIITNKYNTFSCTS